MTQTITVPDYYPKFKCTGPECEDTCCGGGWNISIDRDTYQKYQQDTHSELAPLFKIAVSENNLPSAASENNFGLMKMKPDGMCHFLQADKLCAIHTHMGARALSNTCRIYPRYLNQLGAQRENSLGVSCPEAARLILLNPQPMQFGLIAPEPVIDDTAFTSYRFPSQNDGDPEQMAILHDFRAVIVTVLQYRAISLGARLMVLGFLLEDADKIASSEQFAHASELIPVLETYLGMLDHPEQLEAQFAAINPNIARKIELVSKLIERSLTDKTSERFKECLQDAVEGLGAANGGLLEKYTHSYTAHYRPFMQDKDYIFENYLVNQVITRMFPFTRRSYLDQYRELVCNLAVIQVLLTGIAAKHQGLNEAQVIQLFQTFARNSNHNSAHLDNLIASLRAGVQDSFVHVMWMLKEAGQ
jgi:lysine-N-methylase